ncbi:MAG: hypothetical protein HDS89_07815 [Bacteroidales bacterium]|nr:hypothetical protein [Bacteroidales bacterium]
MKRILTLLVMVFGVAFASSAWILEGYLYDFVGKVDNKYNITVYLVCKEGKLQGKCFYHSTIARQGVKPCSYLYLNGTYDERDDSVNITVTDCKGKYIEKWIGEMSSGNRAADIDCIIITESGKRMTLDAVDGFGW